MASPERIPDLGPHWLIGWIYSPTAFNPDFMDMVSIGLNCGNYIMNGRNLTN